MITTREMKLLEDLIDEEGLAPLTKALSALCRKKADNAANTRKQALWNLREEEFRALMFDFLAEEED